MKQLSPKQIQFLNTVCQGDWTYNPKTGLVKVDGSVYIDIPNLDSIPVSFGTVYGIFTVYGQLKTLKGAPIKTNEIYVSCNDKDMNCTLERLELETEYVDSITFNCYGFPFVRNIDSFVSELIGLKEKDMKVRATVLDINEFIADYYEKKLIELL